MTINGKIVLTPDSTEEEYEELFAKEVGEVFRVPYGYETVLRRIEKYTPAEVAFEVFPITPGTSLFSNYGDSHLIVTLKESNPL